MIIQLTKMYETVEELEEAEKAYDAEMVEREKKAAERKNRADEVQKAYDHAKEVRRAAADMINQADKEYYALRNQFVKDYNGFHWTVVETNTTGDNVINLLGDTLAAWWF